MGQGSCERGGEMGWKVGYGVVAGEVVDWGLTERDLERQTCSDDRLCVPEH